jgi:DNA-binding transcriptional LysR family regulator
VRQIETFLACAQCGSFSGAARELFLSQSMVSRYIGEMEGALGTALFIRGSRGAALTFEGVRLFEELDPVYNRFRVTLGEITRRSPPDGQSVKIGSYRAPEMTRLLNSSVTGFHTLHPGVKATVEHFNFGELRDKLMCGAIDIAFTLSNEIKYEALVDFIKLANVDMHFAIPSSWKFKPDSTDFFALSNQTLIVESRTDYSAHLSICRAHGFEPKDIRFVDSLLTLLGALKRGEAFSFFGGAAETAKYAAPLIDIIPVANKACNEYIFAVAAWRKDSANPQAASFKEALGGALRSTTPNSY